MRDSEPISKHLADVRRGSDARGDLFAYFWDEALECARRYAASAAIDIEKAADIGLWQALSAVRRDNTGAYKDREKFRALFQKIISRRVIDQVRSISIEMPDSSGPVDDRVVEGSEESPAEQVMAKELAETVAMLALREKDPNMALVNVLGRLANYSPSSIQRVLEGVGVERNVGTIANQIKRFDERLRKELKGFDDSRD